MVCARRAPFQKAHANHPFQQVVGPGPDECTSEENAFGMIYSALIYILRAPEVLPGRLVDCSVSFLGVISRACPLLRPKLNDFCIDPNPYPASTAKSETFVAAGSTIVVPVPTTTTTIQVGGNTVVLGPGGTPVNSLVPVGVTQLGAVTPTWSEFSLLFLHCCR